LLLCNANCCKLRLKLSWLRAEAKEGIGPCCPPLLLALAASMTDCCAARDAECGNGLARLDMAGLLRCCCCSPAPAAAAAAFPARVE